MKDGHLGASAREPLRAGASQRSWEPVPIHPCTERLSDAGAFLSVGSRNDAYDNALAETIIGLFKTEVIRNRGPWKNLDEVEYATPEWVDWFNRRRLPEPIGNIPPSEFEVYYWGKEGQAEREVLKEPCLL